MKNAIKSIAKCIVDNNLTEAQIVKELEFLVQLAQKKQNTNFVDQLDRDFNEKPVHFNHECKEVMFNYFGHMVKGISSNK